MMKIAARIKSYIIAHRLPAYIVSAIILCYIILYIWSAHYGRYHKYDKVPEIIGIEMPEYVIWTCYSEWDTEVGDKFADVSDVRLKLWFDQDSTSVTQQVINMGWDWDSEYNCYISKRGIYDIKQIGHFVATWHPEECIIHYSCVVEMPLPDYIMIWGILIIILISLCGAAYFIFRVLFSAIKSLLYHLP